MTLPAYAEELKRLAKIPGRAYHGTLLLTPADARRILRDAEIAEAARGYAKAMSEDWVPARYNRRNELLDLIAKWMSVPVNEDDPT